MWTRCARHKAIGAQLGDLSAHFSRREFRCRGNDCDETPVDPRLVRVLESIRAHLGGYPVIILSGYRCRRHNRRVGGATRSQHLVGRAADIRYQGTLTVAAAQSHGATGVGHKGGRVLHVDVRTGTPAVWRY